MTDDSLFLVNSKGILTLNSANLLSMKEAFNTEKNPIKYLSIDPGNKNGVCGYDEKLYPQFMFTVRDVDMVQFINLFEKLDICIIEDYRIFAHKLKVHANSKVETLRIIGKVEGWAETKGITLIKQPSKIKPTGYAWIKKKPLPKSDPKNHSLDAHVHFMYWAVRAGKFRAEDLLKL